MEPFQDSMRKGHRVYALCRAGSHYTFNVPVVCLHERLRIAPLRPPTQLPLSPRDVNHGIFTTGAHVVPLGQRRDISKFHPPEHCLRDPSWDKLQPRPGLGMIQKFLIFQICMMLIVILT